LFLLKTFKALNCLLCAVVSLRNYSLTHCRQKPTRKPCSGRETARCLCKMWYESNLQRHRAVIPEIARGLFVEVENGKIK